MPLTAAELEEIRLADEAIEREWIEAATERAINEEIDRWVDEMAIMDLLDKRQRKSRAYKREYYEAHKDEIAAYNREYYEAHKDEIAAYKREYYEAHKDEIAAYKREYYEAHKDEFAARQRERMQRNRDAYNAYMRVYMREYRRGKRRREAKA